MTETLLARAAKLRARQEKVRTRLRKWQNARLATGVGFAAGLLIAAIRPQWRIELPLIVVFTVSFPFLVWGTRRIERFLRSLMGLEAFYRRQGMRRRGEAVNRDWETARKEVPADPAVLDLGLVGPHSLFTLLDETVSDGGRIALLKKMVHPRLEPEYIARQQSLIRRLSRHRWFLIRLRLASEQADFALSTQQIAEFLKRPFIAPENAWLNRLVLAGWATMLAAIAVAVAIAAPAPALVGVAGFAALNLWAISRVGSVFRKGEGLALHLSTLSPMFASLESRSSDPVWEEAIPEIRAARPARELGRLNRVLAFLSVEANPLVLLLLNAVTPWTLYFSFRLEKERAFLAEKFPPCLDEFTRLEALMCLVFLHVYQTRVFPEVGREPRLRAHKAFHPLIPRHQVVANDFSFDGPETLGLITGSNMSGKSTFLRTIGVNQALANMGAPVFAERFETFAARLETCIQVSDSLRDGFSYFYAEVLRLKELIASVHAGQPVLYLIDEIFRGTNNRERQIGSRAVIRALAGRESRGFVSTHDLELTHLSEELPSVINLHFRETVQGDQMVFDYHLRRGPCPTTNALIIMRNAGLAVDEAATR